MFHFIFINEASIENEKINTTMKKDASEKDKSQKEQKEKSNQRPKAELSGKWDQQDDFFKVINKN